MGGGDRNLGETGHLGDSRRCSIAVGDLTGAPTFVPRSDVDGRRVGVFAEDRFLDAGAGVGWLCLADREGLGSCWLFFRERIPEFADEVREAVGRRKGLVGEGSRDARGDGAADEEEEGADVCDVNLDGPDSVIGVIVAVLAEDSRDKAGCASSDDPVDMFGDLSISACARGC
ncbi:a4b0aba0-6f85-418c-af19-db999d8721ff [Thermothielavioides terrestris]|uniref:A4b0aba0-6f85-418c-af19-db999d8721ff n=1 Tax=Thermothielavioides terrestris TaxID=2587410 RepID=A0A3S4ALQ4_9PEZI|nr:a4b0aba0-6f85-418c-af19-db999d8721ff [Thermothielavioides terrestris]